MAPSSRAVGFRHHLVKPQGIEHLPAVLREAARECPRPEARPLRPERRARSGSANALKKAAAICERPALWTQAKSTTGGADSSRAIA